MSIKCVGSVLHVRSTAVITAIGRLTLHIPLKTAGSDVKLTCNIFPCAISHSTPYGPMGNGKYCFQWIIHTHSVIFQDDSLWGKKQHTLWKRKCRAEHLTAIILMNYPTCRGAIEDKQWLIVLSWGRGGGVLLPPSLYLTCERNGEWRGWLGLSPAFIPLMIFRGLLPCRCIQSKQSRPGAFFSIPVMEWNAVCMVHVRNSPSWKTNNIRRFHVLLLCFYSN